MTFPPPSHTGDPSPSITDNTAGPIINISPCTPGVDHFGLLQTDIAILTGKVAYLDSEVSRLLCDMHIAVDRIRKLEQEKINHDVELNKIRDRLGKLEHCPPASPPPFDRIIEYMKEKENST